MENKTQFYISYSSFMIASAKIKRVSKKIYYYRNHETTRYNTINLRRLEYPLILKERPVGNIGDKDTHNLEYEEVFTGLKIGSKLNGFNNDDVISEKVQGFFPLHPIVIEDHTHETDEKRNSVYTYKKIANPQELQQTLMFIEDLGIDFYNKWLTDKYEEARKYLLKLQSKGIIPDLTALRSQQTFEEQDHEEARQRVRVQLYNKLINDIDEQ